MIRNTILAVAARVAATMVLSVVVAMTALSAHAGEDNVAAILVPMVDADEGRKLFVSKGFVVCHAVNGAGGRGAPPLDSVEARPVDVAGFAARMWRGAGAMVEWQQIELGYQVELTGLEIGHLAAFAADPAAQVGFSPEDIPAPMRDWLGDTPLNALESNDEIHWE